MMTGIIEVDGKDAETAQIIFEVVDLRLENKRLRAELTTIKPDWSNAPEWASGAVMWKDGGRYWINNSGLRLKEIK